MCVRALEWYVLVLMCPTMESSDAGSAKRTKVASCFSEREARRMTNLW